MRTRWFGLVAAVVVVVAVAVVAVAGCGTRSPAPPAVLRAQNVARVLPPSDAPVAAVAAGIGQLGYRLGQTGTGNWIISPASIAFAFAMVRIGARGATAEEIDKAFGFPGGGRDDAFNAISRAVVTADVPPPPEHSPRKNGEVRPTVMCLGNALFPAAGFPVAPDFLRTIAEQFGAGVYPLDFTKDAATKALNAWIQQQTAGRITKLFDQLDPGTKLVLANTAYLRADWQVPFAKSDTSDQPFHLAGSSTVTARTMHNTAFVGYAQGPGWQAVELPYASGQLAMRILLPSPGGDPNALLALKPAFTKGLVQLSLPTWDFSTDLDLKPALGALGLHQAFTGQADFSGISPGLFIDQAVHRATITVDEAGTEAAAVTGIAMPLSARPPTATAVVNVDHPFAFAIVHAGTGVPLFMGRVGDPTAHAS
jgi:serine protease inhibitor